MGLISYFKFLCIFAQLYINAKADTLIKPCRPLCQFNSKDKFYSPIINNVKLEKNLNDDRRIIDKGARITPLIEIFTVRTQSRDNFGA